MTEEAALIAAICANPVEDTPRLAYADWLDEQAGTVECGACKGIPYLNGLRSVCPTCSGTLRVSDGRRERAEFIRLQIRIARLQSDCLCGACVKLRGGGQHHNGPCAVDKERDELPDGSSRQAFLRRRDQELQCAVCPQWREEQFGPRTGDWINAPLPGGLIAAGFVNVFYSRGFVSGLTCTAAAFMQHAEAIFRALPVTQIRITNSTGAAIEAIDGTWLLSQQWLVRMPMIGYYSKVKYHETAEGVLEELSGILVNHGRKLAGLPPLSHATPMLENATGPYPSSQTTPETTGFPTYPHPSPPSG